MIPPIPQGPKEDDAKAVLAIEDRLKAAIQAGAPNHDLLLAAWKALRQQTARVEALELFATVLGWIADERPALVHSYVMGHYALDPIHDLPTFLRRFPAVDLEGWIEKHGEAMDRVAALQGAKREEET